MLFSEPKIPQFIFCTTEIRASRLSVLFSEPKIPQCGRKARRRAESRTFQCSSASRKFLNESTGLKGRSPAYAFSALQRAENSSIQFLEIGFASTAGLSVLFSEPKIPQLGVITGVTLSALDPFQCSSASRKFLNNLQMRVNTTGERAFSALQRAENSSISLKPNEPLQTVPLSVLFSEPKIPQSKY